MERIALVRPFSGAVIYPDIQARNGADTRSLTGPGDISFTVAPGWHNRVAEDGRPFFMKRGTLVVVERANKTIRQVGLVDDLTLSETGLDVSCGGFSMILGQSGPWEGQQGWYTVKDPVELFYELVAQVQSYPDADLGIRVTGDTASGSSVGSPGSARWQRANRQVQQLKPEVEKWEARVLDHERVLTQRQERMFNALGLKRVGRVIVSGTKPENPGVKADSTIWVNENNRTAYRWRTDHNDWIAYSSANDVTRAWLDYRRNLEVAKDRLADAQYAIEPAEAALKEYASEAREEYSLYFWQNHDLNKVIDDLSNLGPFEYREEAAWTDDDRLDLQLRVGTPKVGVRRTELHLELGVNVHEQPVMEYGETYTGITLFGAGEGSEVLSAQRDLGLDGIVRHVLVETDKDAHTKQLTRAAANKLADQVRKDMGLGFTDLVIHHTNAVPEGSFDVGDEIPITGTLSDGTVLTRWVRVLEATYEWGSNKTNVEVESV